MRVGKRHTLGPKCHVSVASLFERILAVAVEIWIMSAGHFGQIWLFFPLYAMLELPYLHGAQDLARRKWGDIVAYDRGLNAIEFRSCSSGSSGVVQILVRSMISPVAPHAAFCPIRVFIPSMNSKQPV